MYSVTFASALSEVVKYMSNAINAYHLSHVNNLIMKENRTLLSCYVQEGRGPTGGSVPLM